ncbi:MAG: hypothetical protein ACAH17_02705, partial [Candidatus Paceibacterota bacterium]
MASQGPLARAISNVVSALKHGFSNFNHCWSPDPLTSLLIDGILKSAEPPKSLRREPFLPFHLSLLLNKLPPTAENLHLLTAVALALFLALRPVELTLLRRSNVKLETSFITITFQRKKTRKGPVWDTRRIASPIVVDLVSRYLHSAPTLSNDALFDLLDSRDVDRLAGR